MDGLYNHTKIDFMNEKDLEVERLIKLKKKSAWISIISIFAIGVAIIAFLYISQHQNDKINVQQVEMVTKDSVIQKKLNDSLLQTAHRDSLNNIINSFFGQVNKHKFDTLQFYYADTLIRYFKNDSNISKEKTAASDKKFYNWSEDYQRSRFDIQGSPFIKGDTALVKGVFHLDKNTSQQLVFEFHFSDSLKINYLRALWYK